MFADNFGMMAHYIVSDDNLSHMKQYINETVSSVISFLPRKTWALKICHTSRAIAFNCKFGRSDSIWI